MDIISGALHFSKSISAVINSLSEAIELPISVVNGVLISVIWRQINPNHDRRWRLLILAALRLSILTTMEANPNLDMRWIGGFDS